MPKRDQLPSRNAREQGRSERGTEVSAEYLTQPSARGRVPLVSKPATAYLTPAVAVAPSVALTSIDSSKIISHKKRKSGNTLAIAAAQSTASQPPAQSSSSRPRPRPRPWPPASMRDSHTGQHKPQHVDEHDDLATAGVTWLHDQPSQKLVHGASMPSEVDSCHSPFQFGMAMMAAAQSAADQPLVPALNSQVQQAVSGQPKEFVVHTSSSPNSLGHGELYIVACPSSPT
eukprot:jgi/Ulvmu1/10964/UM007_0143.1